MVAWTFDMQKCELSIIFQHLNEGGEIYLTRPTPFKNGVHVNSWWYWVKH